MSFTDRQWNQIRAALTFWNAVAESSRVHPMEHPAVRGFFGNDKPTPLTEEEIKTLLVLRPTPGESLTTLTIASKETGISRDRLWRRLKALGAKPVLHGRTHLYRVEDMTKAIVAVHNMYLRIHGHVEPKPETP